MEDRPLYQGAKLGRRTDRVGYLRVGLDNGSNQICLVWKAFIRMESQSNVALSRVLSIGRIKNCDASLHCMSGGRPFDVFDCDASSIEGKPESFVHSLWWQLLHSVGLCHRKRRAWSDSAGSRSRQCLESIPVAIVSFAKVVGCQDIGRNQTRGSWRGRIGASQKFAVELWAGHWRVFDGSSSVGLATLMPWIIRWLAMLKEFNLHKNWQRSKNVKQSVAHDNETDNQSAHFAHLFVMPRLLFIFAVGLDDRPEIKNGVVGNLALTTWCTIDRHNDLRHQYNFVALVHDANILTHWNKIAALFCKSRQSWIKLLRQVSQVIIKSRDKVLDSNSLGTLQWLNQTTFGL